MAEVSTPSSKCIENEVYNDPFFKFRSHKKTKVVKLRHTWTIHNFSFCCEKTGEKLISYTFSARKNQWNDKSKWRLELYPNGRNKECSGYVSLFIRLVTPNLTIRLTECKLGIVSTKGHQVNIHELNNTINLGKEGSGWGHSKFMEKVRLLKKEDMYLSGDNLTVYCNITATIGIEEISETLTTSESDLSKVLHVSKYYENDYDDPIFKSTSSTLIKIVKFRYIWTINDFGSRSEEKKLISPTFSAGENRWNDKSEWCLSLYPKGMDKESCEYGSLFIVRNTCGESEIQIQYKLSVVNADGEFMENIEDSHRFNKNNNSICYDEFIRRNDLDNQKKKYVVDDKLTICCDITATACSDNAPEILTTPKSDLTNDFAFLLGNSELSDITLSAGGKKYHAHKVVLAVQSPVFRVMFMEESKKNRVDITDLDKEGLMEMLRYMYTGEIHKLKEMAPRLLGVAVEYKLNGLKLTCEKALFESLSIENAAEILILSDKVCATELRNQVKTFIGANVAQVANTAGFENMMQTHPLLVKEALCALGNSSTI